MSGRSEVMRGGPEKTVCACGCAPWQGSLDFPLDVTGDAVPGRRTP